MGLEARCQGRYGLESGEGRLQHEGEKILFRGAFRLDIAVRDLKKVAAAGDDLMLSWGTKTASFSLGAAVAPKWVHKILNPPSLLDKLGIKAGQSVGLKGTFDDAFRAELSTRVEATAVRASGVYDVVMFSFDDPTALTAVEQLAAQLTPAGALWMVYPKGGEPVKETQVRAAGLAAELVDNKTCSFSPVLTALRWVKPRAAR